MSRMIHRRELVQLLSGSLGADKAQALVMEAAVALQLSTIELSYEQSLQLLERIGREPGIVAITAGLARVRLGRLMKSAAASTQSADQTKLPSAMIPSPDLTRAASGASLGADLAKPSSEIKQRVTLSRPQSGQMQRPFSLDDLLKNDT